MIRNQEIRTFFILIILVSLLAVVSASFISKQTMWLTIVFAIILFIIIFTYTMLRYRNIKKLSHYLRQISSGNYSLDVRDNEEGELSILKNEIYKVTNMLAEQSSHLQDDKLHLTTAISDISHQLKTPLTSMMVMADLLDDHQLPSEKRAEFTENIHTQLERLNWLVSSLLKLSKIDAGTVHFKEEKINVTKLINHTIKSVLVPIDIKEQSLTIEGEDSVTFSGDFYWSAEALTNIIKNCVEHTPERGHIEIRFSENVLYTEITISDTGKGIPKEDLPYIFQRFYKGKHASDESVGIGLAMAYQIITSQGGDIEVSSEEDKGTTFQIRFYRKNNS